MKFTLDIPDAVISQLVKHTQAETKKEAILTAIAEYNQRRKVEKVVRHFGIIEKSHARAEGRKSRVSK